MSGDRLDHIILLLGQVDGKLDGLTTKLIDHEAVDRVEFGVIKNDIQLVKSKLNWGSGFASGIGAIIGSLSTLWFKGH